LCGPLRRHHGEQHVELGPGLEQLLRLDGEPLVPHVDPAQAQLGRRAGHDHPAVRARPDRDQVALAQDAQRLVHHRRADLEAADQVGAQPEPRSARQPAGEDLALDVRRDLLGP
jgi:hypothetical protein